MNIKLTAVLLCVLAALGLLTLGQSLSDRLSHKSVEESEHVDVKVHVERHVDASHARRASIGEEVVIDKRFDVREGGTLVLKLSHADVTIGTGEREEAHVRVILSGSNMERAREFFESRNYDVRQEEDRIVVESNPTRRNWNWGSWGRVKIDVEVYVPRRFNADLAMSHGDLNMGALVGNVMHRGSHGDVTLGAIDGNAIELRHSHGDVITGPIKANRLDMKSSHGDLETGAVSASLMNVRQSHGDLQLDVRGGSDLRVSNSHGEIDLSLGAAVGGSISNSHGDIDIEAADGLAANIDFEASDVHLGSSVSFDGKKTDKRAEGAINGGGPRLRARTSHGSITLR